MKLSFRFLTRVSALAASYGFATSCISPTESRPCDSYVHIIIVSTQTAEPEFTWSPGCGVARLAITSNDMYTPAMLWSVVSTTSALYPAILYGELPDGARQTAPATPLTPGSTVVATVYDANRKLLGQILVDVP